MEQQCKTCPMNRYNPSECEYNFKIRFGYDCRSLPAQPRIPQIPSVWNFRVDECQSSTTNIDRLKEHYSEDPDITVAAVKCGDVYELWLAGRATNRYSKSKTFDDWDYDFLADEAEEFLGW